LAPEKPLPSRPTKSRIIVAADGAASEAIDGERGSQQGAYGADSCPAAALLARHWPNRGGRRGAALALAGSLIRVGWPQSEAGQFVFEIARAANDEEANGRRADVRTTGQKVAAGEPVTAGTTCREIFGEKAWRSVSDWLGLRPVSAQLLAAGATITETAEKLGVARQTVSAWRNHNPGFQAT
jgi:hypothetical protein